LVSVRLPGRRCSAAMVERRPTGGRRPRSCRVGAARLVRRCVVRGNRVRFDSRDDRRARSAESSVSDPEHAGQELDRRVFRREPTPSGDVALIASEFLAGFEAVDAIDRPAVSIFGSARVREGSPVYTAAREVGRCFAQAGLAVVTGGGPGVMEAANRGARDGGGLSVGFNIRLPHEQAGNPYCDVLLTFKHFYARKTMFVKAAE